MITDYNYQIKSPLFFDITAIVQSVMHPVTNRKRHEALASTMHPLKCNTLRDI